MMIHPKFLVKYPHWRTGKIRVELEGRRRLLVEVRFLWYMFPSLGVPAVFSQRSRRRETGMFEAPKKKLFYSLLVLGQLL
jgi:hypothetical protein